LKLSQNFWKAYFIVSIAALVFVAGFTVGWQKRFPTSLVESWLAEIGDWRKYPRHRLRTRPRSFSTRSASFRERQGWHGARR